MTETELLSFLVSNFPQENEKCEWKEFKSLKNSIAGRIGEDVISYISAIANMKGGHLILGVKDELQEIVGIQDFADYTKNNVKFRIIGNCSVGCNGGTWGVGRTLMKFPGLATNSTYKGLSASQITNLSLHMYESSGNNTSAYIDVYQYTGVAWNETTAKCNNITWNPSGSEFTWNYFNCTGWQTFNLTSMVATWKGSSTALDKGIMLKNYTSETNTAYSKHFRSAEYGTTSTTYKPYLSYTYNTNVPVSQVCLLPSYVTLDPGETFYMSACVVPSNATNKNVTWTSSNNSVVTVGSSGMLCAKSAGTATITVKSAADSSKYATATISVNKIYNLSWTDSIFVTQLTNPTCGFNQPGSNYAFDFEKAYNLLQLFKTTYAGGSYVKAQTLESLGYCAPGAGIPSEGLLNQIYSYSLIGKSYYDAMMQLNIQWQQHLMIGLSFFYYDLIFNQINRVNINDYNFSPSSPADLLEKDGISVITKHGSLTAWKGYRTGSLSELPAKAQTMYAQYSNHGWQGNVSGQTPGTAAGRTFDNIPKLGEAKLPISENGVNITYKEYDVNNYVPALGQRDGVRFVRGSNGSVYFTQDHYKTYIKIQ